jgi:carbon storage regulator
MLVLSRRPGEKVVIDSEIKVTVVEVQGNRVRLAVEAPDQVRILRAELACWQEEGVDGDEPAKPVSLCGD